MHNISIGTIDGTNFSLSVCYIYLFVTFLVHKSFYNINIQTVGMKEKETFVMYLGVMIFVHAWILNKPKTAFKTTTITQKKNWKVSSLIIDFCIMKIDIELKRTTKIAKYYPINM